MQGRQRGGGRRRKRPTDPTDRGGERSKNTSFIIMSFIMDLRVFPGRSDNQKFYVLGYSVMNKNDALVSKDGEFFLFLLQMLIYLLILNVLKIT